MKEERGSRAETKKGTTRPGKDYGVGQKLLLPKTWDTEQKGGGAT